MHNSEGGWVQEAAHRSHAQARTQAGEGALQAAAQPLPRLINHPSESRLPVLSLLLELHPQRPLVLDGGIVRGALGLALHQIAPQAYAALWENPHPPYRMAFMAPRLKLVLFGQATRYGMAMVQAALLMARNGLGKQRVVCRVGRVLQDCGAQGERVLMQNGQWQSLPQPVLLQDLWRTKYRQTPWRLRMVAPLMLKHQDQLLRQPAAFSVVYSRALERCSRILRLGGELPAPAPDAREAAAAVPILAHTTKWVEFERFSARQRQTMPVGGVGGVVHYGPAPQALLAWVQACETLGLGGKLSFGLGEIEVTFDSSATGVDR